MDKSEKHIHGGTPDVYFRKFGIPPTPVIDYSVNVSPLGPPKILLDRWENLSRTMLDYPTVNGDGIATYYMQRFGLERHNILAGNGSTECLYLVPRVLAFKQVVLVVPSFHDYERSCQLAGTQIREIPLYPEKRFAAPHEEELASALEQADALMLGSPNNPTNTIFSRQTILNLADRFPDKWILVDEAFVQFVDPWQQQTLITPAAIRKNLLVFHSLTKFYDIPGIRLGCTIGHPETIERLQAYKEPWTVNGIAEKAAGLLVDCREYEQELLQLIERERSRFVAELSGIDGLELFDTKTNYFLARWTASPNLDDLLKHLLLNGLYVRDCRNFRHLPNNCFRFSIRSEQDNRRLIEHIKQKQSEF